jgi:hypothetical protein
VYSCIRTPEKVIETLAHFGISISTSTINNTIKSLSVNAQCVLQQLGHTLCTGIAYDNVDILIKAYVPTVEKSTENLKHLTSGLFFHSCTMQMQMHHEQNQSFHGSSQQCAS